MAEGIMFCIQRDSLPSAFSLLNAALENVTSNVYSSFQHSLLAEAYVDLVFKMTSIKRGAKAAAESIADILRGWSVHCVSSLLFNCLVFLNPRLSAAQRAHLLVATSRTMEQFMARGYLDEQVIRSLITLAAPDHGTCLLLNYLIETITGFVSKIDDDDDANDDQHQQQQRQHEIQEDKEIAHVLIKQHAIDRAFVAAMSPGVRKAVFRALRCTGGFREDSAPICCITLEPLLWPDCTVTLDVVAVIQRNHLFGRDHHAFLYRGVALQDWLGRNQVPINPETRSIVKPGDVYRLS